MDRHKVCLFVGAQLPVAYEYTVQAVPFCRAVSISTGNVRKYLVNGLHSKGADINKRAM